MCKYCQQIVSDLECFTNYHVKDDDEQSYIAYYKKEGEFKLYMGELGHHSCTINFCPWCGRKLIEEMMNDLEVIDFSRKGNAIRLYLGKNGEQTGDDCDDIPYEHNAETVYDEYVKGVVDIFIPLGYKVIEAASEYVNSPYSKDHFKNRKHWAILVDDSYMYEYDYNNELHNPVKIFFGDTLGDIRNKLRDYHIVMMEVEQK